MSGAFVQTKFNGTASALSTTVSITGVVAGHHLMAVNSQSGTSGTPAAGVKAPTSTPTATWSTGIAGYGDTNSLVGQGIYYTENVASGSWSIVFGTTSTSACAIGGIVNESSGVATSASLGAVNHAASTGASTLATGSITPVAGSVVYMVTTDAGGTATADTISAGTVIEAGGTGSSWDALTDGYPRSGAAHSDNVAASAINATWTLPASAAVAAGIIEFKAAGSGSTPISASDSAALTDTVSQIGVTGPTDSGALGESSTIGAGLGTSDSASLAEQQAIALLNTDTAAFAEQIAIAVTKSDSDSAQVGEQASIGASTSTQDTGQVGDQAAVTASTASADTAAIAEQIKIALTAVDSAQLGEAMAIRLATGDTAQLQELVSVALAIADAASLGTETLSVQQNGGNTPSSSDSATLTDAQLAIAARVAASDIGTLAEQAAIALQATDVAVMTEQIGLGLIAADSAALTEQLRVAITASVGDSAALADVQLAVNAALAAADAATLGESVSVQVFGGGLRDWVYAISQPTLKWSVSEPSGKWSVGPPIQ